MKCSTTEDVVRYLKGDLTGEQSAALDAHRKNCGSCNSLFFKVAELGQLMAPQPGEFDNMDISAEVISRIRSDRESRTSGNRFFSGWSRWKLVGALGMSMVLVVVAISYTRHSTTPSAKDENFLRRGSERMGWDRWVSVHAFRKTKVGYEPVGKYIQRDDKLAFAYENRQGTGYSYVMILALDEREKIFWYYPFHDRMGKYPESIEVKESRYPISLPDEVRHELRPGSLRVFAVFSKSPLTVKQVERQIVEDFARVGSLDFLERIDLADTGQHSFVLTVLENEHER